MAERTMEELLRAPTEGYGEAIVLPEINADHFEIKTNLLQLVQANPFYGRESENPHAHINSFKRITSTLRFRNVPNDVIKLMMFPYSLEGAAKTWYEKEPPNSILTWEDLVTKFVNQFFPPSKTTHLKNEISRFTQKFEETFSEAWERFKELLRACPHHGFTELTQVDTFYNGLNENEQDSLNAAAGGNLLSKTTREALNIIENKSKVRYSRNRSNASRMNVTSSKTDERIDKLADQLSTLVEIVSKKVVTPAPVKAVEESCVTCATAHSWYNCPATDNNQASVCATTGTYNLVNPSNRVSNQMEPPVERETEETTDKEQTNFQGSTAQIPPPVIPISIPEPDVPKTLPKTTPILESDIPKSLPKPNIPYPSRRDDQKSRDKGSNQMEKIFQIFQDLRFDLSFADALLLMPRFAPTIKSLLMNKEKLFELAKIPLNENCSAMLLKNLPEKLGDPGKFLIPCNFPGLDVCHALADQADPRVPLILGRSFLRTSHALIDVYEGELVLRDGNEQITFHVNGMSKHPQKHVNKSIKIVNDACKDSFKRFTDEPDLVCLTPPKDVNNEKEKQEVNNLAEPTAKRQTRITPCLKNFKVICNESIFHSNKPPQVSLVFAITSTLPSIEPKDSLIMGDEHLSTFSTEEIVPIPRKYEETSRSDSKNVLPSCDDFSPIFKEKSTTLSNPLFNSNDDFTFSDDESLSDEDVPEDVKIYSNPLFEFDDEYIFIDFLVTPLSDSNKDGCLAPEDDIEILLHHDPSTPLKSVVSILEEFIKDSPFEENDDLLDLECKTNDEAECFDPGGDNDEIDAFLAIEVPTYIEGYYDSEGDVLYLKSLLSEDTTHNLSPEVFFDHEPQQLRNEPENEPLITFSPKSDPLYHELTGELITIPPRIVREHKDYINRMLLLCGNSSSRSPENSHTIIESLPTSTTLVENSNSNREEIDIFFGPADSIPPGIESDFDLEEDIIDNLLNDDSTHERLTFNIDPDAPVINNVDELNEDECFDPGGGEINVEINNSFTFVTRIFLPYLTYPEVSPLLSSTKNEDTIFNPDIST
ncbi:reverse transcriptase domain-containing protein [Tanacetum coccineum]|uniref:Reverse transcriptase domain-containing protein n=1 Tax=Tanacetum coccineum TaxID=301880 RepID=A0ABQ5CWP1_9ASTR